LKAFLIFIVVVLFTGGYFTWIRHNGPFVKKANLWSIGIYTGSSPFDLFSPGQIQNPVLTADHVTDVDAEFFADPFMVKENSIWYIFFEVLNAETDQGDIALATSNDGFNWNYKRIVLDESFHLSYPYVFKWENEYYMIPESMEANSIRLYKALEFPHKWIFIKTLIKGPYVDSSIFHRKGLWWVFLEANPKRDDTLKLYYSNSLYGPFTEHPASPIRKDDPGAARPSGRIIVYKDRIFRFSINTDPEQSAGGNHVRAFEITQLTKSSYKEKEVKESPVVKASGSGWNKDRMHHVDAHRIKTDN